MVSRLPAGLVMQLWDRGWLPSLRTRAGCLGGPLPENCSRISTRAPWQVHTHTHAHTRFPTFKTQKASCGPEISPGHLPQDQRKTESRYRTGLPTHGTCPCVLAEELKSLKGAGQQGGGAAWVRAWGSRSINAMITIIYDSCFLFGAYNWGLC